MKKAFILNYLGKGVAGNKKGTLLTETLETTDRDECSLISEKGTTYYTETIEASDKDEITLY